MLTDLSRLLLEISLLESAYRNRGATENDVLLTTAKRCRIDVEKVHKAAAQEFIAKQWTKEISLRQERGLSRTTF